jgi:hypothetical protein
LSIEVIVTVVVRQSASCPYSTGHLPHDSESDFSYDAPAANNIYYVVKKLRLSSSTVFLALWYIAQLPLDLVESANALEGSPGDICVDELVFQTFVVGAILANKWLDDSPPCSWHWFVSQWVCSNYWLIAASRAATSHLSLRLVNNLEASALLALDYNLSIGREVWQDWLVEIRSYHASACVPCHVEIEWDTGHGFQAYDLVDDMIHSILQVSRRQRQAGHVSVRC